MLPKCPHCKRKLSKVKVWVKNVHTLDVSVNRKKDDVEAGLTLKGVETDPESDARSNEVWAWSFTRDERDVNGKLAWDAECGFCCEDVTEVVEKNMIAVY